MDNRSKIYSRTAEIEGVTVQDVKECMESQIDLLLQMSKSRTPVRLPGFGLFYCKVPIEGRTYSKQQQEIITRNVNNKKV